MILFSRALSLSLLVTATGSLLIGCSGDGGDSDIKAPPPSVSVIKVETSPVGDYREYVARTEAHKEVELRARVEGTLIERDFREGQSVQENQLLFKIDPASFLADVKKANAQLNSQLAAYRRAERDMARGKELAPQGYISQSDLDKLISNADQASAQVESAKAALKQAKLNLDYTDISAPFDGQVGKAYFSEGNLVGPSSGPLATLVDIDPIYVNFQVDEDLYVTYLQHKAVQGEQSLSSDNVKLTLRLPNNTVLPNPGKLNFTDTQVDQTTGTINLRAQFDNPDNVVLPGLYVTLMMEATDKKELPLIPQASVQENQQGKFVLVVDENNTVKPQPVDMGRRINAMWVVNKGLNGGEQIIIEGLQKVRPGVVVAPSLKMVDLTTGALTDTTQGSSSSTDREEG
jgi:membrane fusion protein, multidrug efflux system